MCLAYPAKIVSRRDDEGIVDQAGNQFQISLILTPDAKKNDYVLVHAGYAIQIIDEQSARETFEIFDEIDKHFAPENPS
jgi:hydrogenase expression/formation protein HypC